MNKNDIGYLVIADWPRTGREIWRAGVFDSHGEAVSQWAARANIDDGAEMVAVVRISVSELLGQPNCSTDRGKERNDA